jgi:hypothetical protein
VLGATVAPRDVAASAAPGAQAVTVGQWATAALAATVDRVLPLHQQEAPEVLVALEAPADQAERAQAMAVREARVVSVAREGPVRMARRAPPAATVVMEIPADPGDVAARPVPVVPHLREHQDSSDTPVRSAPTACQATVARAVTALSFSPLAATAVPVRSAVPVVRALTRQSPVPRVERAAAAVPESCAAASVARAAPAVRVQPVRMAPMAWRLEAMAQPAAKVRAAAKVVRAVPVARRRRGRAVPAVRVVSEVSQATVAMVAEVPMATA